MPEPMTFDQFLATRPYLLPVRAHIWAYILRERPWYEGNGNITTEADWVSLWLGWASEMQGRY